jgi:hypothetical protein
VPLAKQMRGLPSFDLSKIPAMIGGGLLGILRAAIKPSFIIFLIVALALIFASYIYVDRSVATWLQKFQNSAITGIFRKSRISARRK